MDPAPPRSTALFGPFRLNPQQQLLLEEGVPVRLGIRALVLLCALVERAGDVLSRQELEARAWPSTVVEETSLRVQIAALRKVLGDGQGARYIVNVIGRGYSFVAPVQWEGCAPDAAPALRLRHNLPERLTRMVGRDDAVRTLRSQIARRRMVSIVGPGGIGKTVVALAVAEAEWQRFEHGACFVDLAPLDTGAAVEPALAAALANVAPDGSDRPALHAALRERQLLIVFDNCEHVVGAVAALCEDLLRVAPGLRLLATSREPINVDGEWVHRLPTLDTPDPADAMDVGQALGHAAVRLFADRAMASAESFTLSAANLAFVRQVCVRLDGMPLAIELAAARVGELGVPELSSRLDDVFEVLQRQRQAGDPRHRALKAVLEWSHGLLSQDERTVLRRLSVFRAAFTLEAASRVVADEGGRGLDGRAVVTQLLSLVDKSLVTVSAGTATPLYRLLFATRSFAELQLESHGETTLLRRRHLQHFRDDLVARRADPQAMGNAAFLAYFQQIYDDTSAAIDWGMAQADAPTRELALLLALHCNLGDVGRLDPQMVRFERISLQLLELSPRDRTTERYVVHNWCRFSGMSNAFGQPQDDMFAVLREAMVDAPGGRAFDRPAVVVDRRLRPGSLPRSHGVPR